MVVKFVPSDSYAKMIAIIGICVTEARKHNYEKESHLLVARTEDGLTVNFEVDRVLTIKDENNISYWLILTVHPALGVRYPDTETLAAVGHDDDVLKQSNEIIDMLYTRVTNAKWSSYFEI